MLKDKPCKIIDYSTSKTGKHGSAKAKIIGTDIFTGQKYEDICPTTSNMMCPNVTRTDMLLTHIGDDGYLSVLDENMEEKTDLKLPEGELGEDIKKRWEEEEDKDIFVTVLSAMGMEQVVGVKTG